MNIGFYGILVIFAAFIILLIINPKLSCFGKRVTSPLYPLIRRRRMRDGRAGHRAAGAGPGQPSAPGEAKKPGPKTEDYGFHLDNGTVAAEPDQPNAPRKPTKPASKTNDYGFHLDK
jgi:hypothetical protein